MVVASKHICGMVNTVTMLQTGKIIQRERNSVCYIGQLVNMYYCDLYSGPVLQPCYHLMMGHTPLDFIQTSGFVQISFFFSPLVYSTALLRAIGVALEHGEKCWCSTFHVIYLSLRAYCCQQAVLWTRLRDLIFCRTCNNKTSRIGQNGASSILTSRWS